MPLTNSTLSQPHRSPLSAFLTTFSIRLLIFIFDPIPTSRGTDKPEETQKGMENFVGPTRMACSIGGRIIGVYEPLIELGHKKVMGVSAYSLSLSLIFRECVEEEGLFNNFIEF